MLIYSSKFLFDPSAKDSVLGVVTEGATVYSDGRFEVATDQDLSYLGGVRIPVSQLLAFRVTAKSLDRLFYWVGRLAGHLSWVAVTRQQGYWKPTEEWEDSWLLETDLRQVPAELKDELEAWMTDQDQQAVYLELGGSVFIYGREELPLL